MAAMDGPDRMKPTSTAKLTYEDFLSFPDDGRRHELIDGEHYVTASPATKHQRLVGRLHASLFLYLQSRGTGEVFTAPFDVVLSSSDVVEPDLLVVLEDQADILTDQHVRGAPAIVIEILSPATRVRDEQLKRGLYERAGVREYWLVDPQRDAITLCGRAPDGGLVAVVHLASSETLTSSLLPGFSMPLSDLFR